MTFIKYSLTRGLAFGLLMTFTMVFNEAIENGFGSISLETLYSELYWIPFGILVFGPFFWWANKRSGKDN
jgi:hypothetical protein